MDAQTRWEDQRARDCAEHNQPKCPKFPDHACDECHSFHVEEGDFNKFCEICWEEQCGTCKGSGYLEDGETSCPVKECQFGRLRI